MKLNNIISLNLCLFIIMFFGCLSLDSFLFHEESIKEYKMYDYTGEMECSDALDFLDNNGYQRLVTKEVSFKSGNETIYGILASNDSIISPNDTIILYFHGTSDHIDYVWPRVALLGATGYSVFAIDYKGYGKSEGEPTENGLNEDGFSALAFLRDSMNMSNIIVYAYSLGTLVGGAVAEEDTNLIQLIFETPIGSVETLAEDASYLNIPGSYVTTFTGNNIKRIENVKIPFFWMHGDKDETLHMKSNGEPIWNNYNGEKGYCIIVKNAGHTNIPKVIGYERYINVMKDFIQDRNQKDSLIVVK